MIAVENWEEFGGNCGLYNFSVARLLIFPVLLLAEAVSCCCNFTSRAIN